MKNECLFVLLIIFIVTHVSLATNSATDFSNNIGFKQNFNIYQWWYGFQYDKWIQQKSQLKITEDFRSSLLRIRENEKRWKDDQHLGIDFSWHFSPKWIGKIISSSLIFSDKISGIKNDIKTNLGSIGIQFLPTNFIQLSSQLGYKFDERYNHVDHGMMYSFGMNSSFMEINNYYNKLNFALDGDDFGVRKNRDLNVSYQVKKEFYTDTSDSLSITYSKSRKDNYDLADISQLYIESLNEDEVTIHNKLNYKISDRTKIKLYSTLVSNQTEVKKLNYAAYDEERSKRDFSSLNRLQFELKGSKLTESIEFSYFSERQKNDVPDSLKNSPFSYRFSYVSPDFKMSRLSLTNAFNIAFSRFDSLASNFSVSIFRYDTPEKTNYDDRDELSIHGNLSQTHYFSPFLKLKLNMGVNLKHLVFIYSEKSADNNWMRIFILNPELYYKPNDKFKLYQTVEVLANYVDYDFENQLTPFDIRSYVFRKFSMQHVLNYQLSKLTTFSMNYKLELEENGKLYWDDWTEMIITTRHNHYNNIFFDFHFLSSTILSLGTVFLKRDEQLHISESSGSNSLAANNDYISFGPSIKLMYEPHSQLKFVFSGTRRFIDRIKQKRYFINNIHVNLTWYM